MAEESSSEESCCGGRKELKRARGAFFSFFFFFGTLLFLTQENTASHDLSDMFLFSMCSSFAGCSPLGLSSNELTLSGEDSSNDGICQGPEEGVEKLVAGFPTEALKRRKNLASGVLDFDPM